MSVQPRSGRRPLALVLMVASGFAGLGYQVVWTRQCALWLGHEAAAVLAVVAAFFGGLALGAFALGRQIERSVAPARAYAACEAVIALWGLVLAVLMAPASGWLLDVIGEQPGALRQWGLAFCGTFVLLLPATAAMGATLPAMDRVLDGLRERGGSIATLYAGNTAGALLGVLATTFWLVPAWGLRTTALVCAGCNLLCAGVALRALHAGPPSAPPPRTGHPARLAWWLAASGLLGIGYEVLVVRVLSQVAENTVYTFALLLAVYLVGSALGAAWYARRQRRPLDDDRLQDTLACGLALACLAGTASLWFAADLQQALLRLAGPGMPQALAAEAALALAAFALPTVAMGALFSHLCTRARRAGMGLGQCLAMNTLGAALAPLLVGVALAPAAGAKGALLAVAGAYLLLATRRTSPAWAVAGWVLVLGVAAPPLVFVDVPDGGTLLDLREGAMGTVSVVQDARGVASLHIDNRQQEGSSATGWADARQALLPLLLHPRPRQALFLGLGTGVTASAATADPALQVDVVELVPEVVETMPRFVAPVPAALHPIVGDARRFVRTTHRRYDLIVADNFHPARSGAGALYTVEHFRAVGERLAPGGLYCQWLPVHQFDLATLRSVVRTFLAVYPEASAVLATYSLDTPVLGLLARNAADPLDPAAVRERLAAAAGWQTTPSALGFEDEWALLGSFVAGPRGLAAWAGDAPLNTDDRPVVAYGAPRITYAPDSLPRERLAALLHGLGASPGELFAPAPPDWTARLQAYWSARDRFIDAGQAVRPVADARQMLAQVQQPLLAVLRTSPDFRPAYGPLLRLAGALGPADTDPAIRLLRQLQALQPARPEAAQLLQQMAGTQP